MRTRAPKAPATNVSPAARTGPNAMLSGRDDRRRSGKHDSTGANMTSGQ